MVPQALGKGLVASVEDEFPVVAYSVGQGILARQDRGVRWRRDRNCRVGAFETYTLCRQKVERGSLNLCVAVAADPVCTRGVERHQQDVPGPAADDRNSRAAQPRRRESVSCASRNSDSRVVSALGVLVTQRRQIQSGGKDSCLGRAVHVLDRQTDLLQQVGIPIL